jgi:hypothetical protein
VQNVALGKSEEGEISFVRWERTRLACRFGRRARIIVAQILHFCATSQRNEVFGEDSENDTPEAYAPKPIT